jgi:hypothetical protein
MAVQMQRTPTESMRASAQAHLELSSDWRYFWSKGVRYVRIISATSGKLHVVRADSMGCDCEAYLVWEYTACSHMLAVRESLNRDALAAWVDDQDAGVELAFMALATSKRGHGAGVAILKRYESIWTED